MRPAPTTFDTRIAATEFSPIYSLQEKVHSQVLLFEIKMLEHE
jgi:hypothetical protein